MILEGTKYALPVYSSWFGKPVVMLVVFRQCHFPMPCRIVGESAADVRVRIEPGWEMDIRKDLILAVEEAVVASEKPGEMKGPPKVPMLQLPAFLTARSREASVAKSASKTWTISQMSTRLI